MNSHNKSSKLLPFPSRTNSILHCSRQQISENVDDYKTIVIKLDDLELQFFNGMWHEVKSQDKFTEAENKMRKMKQHIKQLETENKILLIKIDVLLDFLVQNVNELNKLKTEPNI